MVKSRYDDTVQEIARNHLSDTHEKIPPFVTYLLLHARALWSRVGAVGG